MIAVRIAPLLIALIVWGPASAQTSLGEAAKGLLGAWEFSNADRDKVCTATFKAEATPVGFKVEFDANCGNLFPIVSRVVGWKFPENDNLFLLDADGKTLVEFSEVETGMYEAPTPGVGVLFLQAAGGGPPPKPPEQVAGTWAIVRKEKPVCTLTLASTALRDGYALTVQSGCAADIVRLNFGQWRLERGELLLVPARGNPWRFEEGEGGNWSRVTEGAEEIGLVRQ